MHIRKSLGVLTAALAVVAVSPVFAAELAGDCKQPPGPVIPDGSAATEEQLIQAQTDVKHFLGEADVYLACLKKAESGLDPETEEHRRHALTTAHNEMVDQMHLIGDEFNVAVRRFNNR
ncbi:MAG: hypothetical protein HKO62_04440 [Gammaproteobacteria bacterium]|nr:hypothetical protein [Gammaproteobacteria bacterium]NNL99976.1 hypothetical protein [Gammaproteobacteria bacterium]